MSKAQGGGGGGSSERGGFVLGLIVGLLIGLAVALGVALYINKTPIPFVNKVPQRTAEQDAEEAARNKNWDPNAPLAGKNAKAASGVVSGGEARPAAPVQAPTSTAPAPATTAPAATPAPAPAPATAPAPAPAPAASKTTKAEAKQEAKAPAADPSIYFVQAGAYLKNDDAESQRAKLALLGHAAKIYEFEQSGRTVYRVRIGPVDAREEAESLQKKLESSGVEANLVRVQR